jgi:hypothetical protein
MVQEFIFGLGSWGWGELGCVGVLTRVGRFQAKGASSSARMDSRGRLSLHE